VVQCPDPKLYHRIRGHTAPYAHGKIHWKILANGYLDTLLYERRAIDTSMPFEQIKTISRINDKALKAGNSADFPQRYAMVCRTRGLKGNVTRSCFVVLQYI